MKKIILPLALLLIIATPAISLAMEGPPQPMRHLYLESELIVVATVWAVSTTLNQQGERIVVAELSPDLVMSEICAPAERPWVASGFEVVTLNSSTVSGFTRKTGANADASC